MTGLHISEDLELPLDLVTEATAIVATRGAGKSSAGAVLVEEAIAAGVPTVVIDWTGVFWGLRSSADGTKAGLAIYVLGGQHGDVPLEASAGKVIADLVVDSGHSFVLDLSDFTKGQMRRFCADFLDRLYERKARQRTTLLLLIDEAHELAPQSPRGGFKGDAARLIAAMEQVAALGRSRGLGVVMITQRTQALNKAVLDLIETLLVMRMLSPRAVAAVRDWIVVKNEDDEHGVLPSLPKLPTGTCWVWSPLRGILQQIDVRRIGTFDSYATPKPGEVRVEPKARKELDLAALGEQMAATVERAKADDPVELRKRVADLQRQIDAHTCPVPEPLAAELVEVPVLDPTVAEELRALVDPLSKNLNWLTGALIALSDSRSAFRPGAETSLPGRMQPTAAREARPRPVPRAQPVAARGPAPAAGQGTLSKAQTRILTALAQHGPKDKISLAILTGYSHKGGGFNNPLGFLRSSGYVSPAGTDPIEITQGGVDALGDYEPLPTGRALLAWWLPQLSGAEKKIVGALDEYGPMEKVDLAEAAGYEPSGGGFNNPLGHLRTLGIITAAKVSPIALAPEMGD